MTLDCRLATEQPRVISLRSWYLTSLVNLSFYRLDAVRSLRFPFPFTVLQTPYRLFSKRELLECGLVSFGGLRLRLFREAFLPFPCFENRLDPLPADPSSGFVPYMSCVHSFPSNRTGTAWNRLLQISRALRFTCTLVPPLDYKLAQRNGKSNMGIYINRLK